MEVSQYQSGIYSPRERPMQHSKSFHESSLPSPPLPPPPPPNYSSLHDKPQTKSGRTSPAQKPSGAGMRVPAPPSQPVPKPPGVPPPAPPPPPPPPTSTKSPHDPPPPPPLPSANPSVSNVTVSLQNPQVTHGSGLSSASAFGSPSRQQNHPQPPPPPPMSAGTKHVGNEDFGIEQDVK